jgi:hypothetical protein
MSLPFLAEILRLFTAFVLLAAVWGKLRNLGAFRANLSDSFGMPAALGRLAAPSLVAAELLLAAAILGPFATAGMLAALALFAGFTALLSVKFVREGAFRCACFGETERNLSGLDLLRNLLVAGAIGAWCALAGAGMTPHAGFHVMLLAAGLALILAVLAVEFHDIVNLLRTY